MVLVFQNNPQDMSPEHSWENMPFEQWNEESMKQWIQHMANNFGLSEDAVDELLDIMKTNKKFGKMKERLATQTLLELKNYFEGNDINNEDDLNILIEAVATHRRRFFSLDHRQQELVARFNNTIENSGIHSVKEVIDDMEDLSQEILDAFRGYLDNMKELDTDKKNDFAEMTSAIDIFESVCHKNAKILNEQKEKWLNKRPQIFIMGNVNAGKSSLMNALLREDPTTEKIVVRDEPCTQDVIHIEYASTPDDECTEPKCIRLHNPLLQFITLVDTPGLADEKKHTEKITELSKTADMILFVIDGPATVGQHQKKIIKDLTPEQKRKTLYLCNKFDRYDGDPKARGKKQEALTREIQQQHTNVNTAEQIHFLSVKRAIASYATDFLPLPDDYQTFENIFFQYLSKTYDGYRKQIGDPLHENIEGMKNLLGDLRESLKNTDDEISSILRDIDHFERLRDMIPVWRLNANKELNKLRIDLIKKLQGFWKKNQKVKLVTKKGVQSRWNEFAEYGLRDNVAEFMERMKKNKDYISLTRVVEKIQTKSEASHGKLFSTSGAAVVGISAAFGATALAVGVPLALALTFSVGKIVETTRVKKWVKSQHEKSEETIDEYLTSTVGWVSKSEEQFRSCVADTISTSKIDLEAQEKRSTFHRDFDMEFRPRIEQICESVYSIFPFKK